MDEQHSRPQRKTYGAAPFCTCTVMTNDKLICDLTHVDNEITNNTSYKTKGGSQVKSKSKIAHCMAFDNLLTIDSKLTHVTVDQSTDAKTDANAILNGKWPDLIICYDLWHKVYPFTSTWKQFTSQRTQKYSRTYKYPLLQHLMITGQLPAYKFKSWWVNCSESCNNDKKTFEQKWLGAAQHYQIKYTTTLQNDELLTGTQTEQEQQLQHMTEGLTEWLTKQLDGVEHFLCGKRTNWTESFHHVANKYYSKGQTMSFTQYVM